MLIEVLCLLLCTCYLRTESRSSEFATLVTLLISALYGQEHRYKRQSAKIMAPTVTGGDWYWLAHECSVMKATALLSLPLYSNQPLQLRSYDFEPVPRNNGTFKCSCQTLSGDDLSHVLNMYKNQLAWHRKQLVPGLGAGVEILLD